uniref:Uncharacterized protein n=1 Tax=Oryza brachyantha TaxID=4533 RepID=J3N3R1_ORYBR
MGELKLIPEPAVGAPETKGELPMFSSVSMRCAALQIMGAEEKEQMPRFWRGSGAEKNHAGWGRRARELGAFGGIAPLSTRAWGNDAHNPVP